MMLYASLKFLAVVCIGLALLAAFHSVRVSMFTKPAINDPLRSHPVDAPKVSVTVARYGSFVSTVACVSIIVLVSAISLYVTFKGRTVQ